MLPKKFYDREKDIQFLNKASAKGFNLIVIYGRRRVGKSELIKQFIKEKRSTYILCTNDSVNENIKSFKHKLSDLSGKDFIKDLDVDNFFDLFKHFTEAFEKEAVIAIDEFPFLLELNKGFLSVFQKIIDELLRTTNLSLILSGSSLSMMEKDVLGYRSPLYGRNVNSWKLNPFEFKVLYGIFKDIDQAIDVYFTLGNIPYYIMFYDPASPLETNLEEIMLNKGLKLYDEPLVLLREEFRESRTYRTILKYISLGYKSLGKLCSALGMDKSNVSKYLDTLQKTGFIRYILPLGMKRKGIYEIIDPFFDFWFRFIYSRRDDLELGNIEPVIKNIIKNKDTHFGKRFEYLIEELMRSRELADLSPFSDIRKWWHKENEIDIVALNEDKKEILFAECKWQTKVNPEKVLAELKEKSKLVDWNIEKRKEKYAIFAKSFSKRIKGVFLYDLKDIEKAMK